MSPDVQHDTGEPSSLSGARASTAPDQSNTIETRQRRREWNRGPLTDLFPRIPAAALERLLDLYIDKGFTYNLSDAKLRNARRYISMTVAHVRHQYTDYDELLRGEPSLERYEVRKRTAESVWKVLREWSPWDCVETEIMERCLKATLVRPEERDERWDPMDVDEESEDERGDAMDLD